MSDLPNISEEYEFFSKLFETAEKEQTGDLYKKNLYVMKDDLESNKYKTPLKVMHDTLLKKFISEEYIEFKPKNEIAQLLSKTKQEEVTMATKKDKNTRYQRSSDKQKKQSEILDKDLKEEFDYLKEVYKLNYLTFSPFALDYFDKMTRPNNSENKNEKQKINSSNNLNVSFEKIYEERETENDDGKLLNLINFDYNDYEINNDLLFNISQGFIDVTKLKEKNVNNHKKQMDQVISNYDSEKIVCDEKSFESDDDDLDINKINKINKFVEKYKDDLFMKCAIIKFKAESEQLPNDYNNKQKNEFYEKWEKQFDQLKNDCERHKNKMDEEKRKMVDASQKFYIQNLKIQNDTNEKEIKKQQDNDFIQKLMLIKKNSNLSKNKKHKNIYRSADTKRNNNKLKNSSKTASYKITNNENDNNLINSIKMNSMVSHNKNNMSNVSGISNNDKKRIQSLKASKSFISNGMNIKEKNNSKNNDKKGVMTDRALRFTAVNVYKQIYNNKFKNANKSKSKK